VAQVEQREEALLITGVFGSGKSSTAVEIAYILESRGAPFALLDLDFLGWFAAADETAHQQILSRNLAALVKNYRTAGVRLFVLAYAVADAAELAHLTSVLAMPVRTVRLVVPMSEIERRLESDVTSGRREDLREASRWAAISKGIGIEELTVSNDRPIQLVASEILDWLGWLQ
jgi:adenylylsulfate kinase